MPRSTDYDNLEDAAAAALTHIRGMRGAQGKEYIALLYQDPETGAIRFTEPMNSANGSGARRAHAKGQFTIPAGSLRGIVHNHPPRSTNEFFSPDDIATATQQNVPSFIEFAPRGGGAREQRRFDPNNPTAMEDVRISGVGSVKGTRGEQFLAAIPLEQIFANMESRGLPRRMPPEGNIFGRKRK